MHWQDNSESTLMNQLLENNLFMHMKMKTVPRRVNAVSVRLDFSCKVHDKS